MSANAASESAAAAYAEAYTVHYTDRDLARAIELYAAIVTAFPAAGEAGYARSQIRNIAHSVVPEPDLLQCQVDLALARLRRAE